MLLKDKVAIVTGGAQGIGKAIAELFSREGAELVLADKKIDTLSKTAEEISKNTARRCISVEADVSVKLQVDNLISRTVAELGKIDILVNNAGIVLRKLIMDMSEQEWDRIMDINLKSCFLCSQAAAREMIKRKSGKIIYISSCSAKKPTIFESAYSTTKAGMLGFNRVIAAELGPYGINCNAILPGATDTEMIRNTFLTSKEVEQEWIEKTALKRLGRPVDIARVALFLASELSDHVTGEQIVVSAGEMMSQ